MKLGEFIKKQRKLHGMTQVVLSYRAGVGLRFIREMEQGKKTLRMDKVNDVLHLFGKKLGPVDWRPEIEHDVEMEPEYDDMEKKDENESDETK